MDFWPVAYAPVATGGVAGPGRRSGLLWALAWAAALGGSAALYASGPAGGADGARAPDLGAAAAAAGGGGDTDSDAAADSRCAPTGDGDVVACAYGGEAFLDVASVAAYFDDKGVAREDALAIYLPREYRVTYSPSRMGVGAAGRVAFCLYLPEYAHEPSDLYAPLRQNGTFSTLLVVADYEGRIRAAAVGTDLDRDGSYGASTTRFDALKVLDPSTVAAYSNVDSSEKGYLYRWAWRTGRAPARANDRLAYSSHDFQIARPEANGTEPTEYWVPGLEATFQRRTLADGAVAASFSVKDAGCPDGINHLQMLDADTRALVSCKGSNGVMAYDIANGAVEWIAGGAYGTVPVVDGEDGSVFPPGTDVWRGQHNVETFGDRILMFDNAYGANASSRILSFSVRDGVAVVDWKYELPYPYPYGYSEVFGDAELLPSGNVLTNWWPAELAPSLGLTADLYFQEITPEKTVAWELAVFDTSVTVGAGLCVEDGDAACARSKQEGWKAYSVERFYEAPLVYGARYASGGLAFTAHAALKRSYATAGTWVLLDASLNALGSGRFAFAAHQRPTEVEVRVGGPAASLRVSDEWAQAVDVDLASAAANAEAAFRPPS